MKLLDFVVCDDIRHERGDKLSFMGVFADTIKVQVPKGAPRPIPFRVAVFFRILIDDTDPVPDRFKATLMLGGTEIAKFEGTVGPRGRPRLMGFPLPLGAVPIEDNTVLTAKFSAFLGERLLLEATPPYSVDIQVVEIDTIQLMGNDKTAEAKQ
jgi:hypothetical protein